MGTLNPQNSSKNRYSGKETETADNDLQIIDARKGEVCMKILNFSNLNKQSLDLLSR